MTCATCRFAKEHNPYPEVETEIKMEAPFLFGKPKAVEIVKPGTFWEEYQANWCWDIDEMREWREHRNEELRNKRECRLMPEPVEVQAAYKCGQYVWEDR